MISIIILVLGKQKCLHAQGLPRQAVSIFLYTQVVTLVIIPTEREEITQKTDVVWNIKLCISKSLIFYVGF